MHLNYEVKKTVHLKKSLLSLIPLGLDLFFKLYLENKLLKCWDTNHSCMEQFLCVWSHLSFFRLLFFSLIFVLHYKPVGHFVHYFALFMNLKGMKFFILLLVVLKVSISRYLFNKILE